MCATLRKSYGTSYSKVTVRRTPTRYGTSRKRYGMSHYGTSHTVDYGTSYGRQFSSVSSKTSVPDFVKNLPLAHLHTMNTYQFFSVSSKTSVPDFVKILPLAHNEHVRRGR